MVFADKRYARKDKISMPFNFLLLIIGKLPLWIQDQIEKKNTSISTDMAVEIAKNFFKDMGQPFEFPEGLLYDERKLEELNHPPQLIRVEVPKEEDNDDDSEENIITIKFDEL